MNNHLVILGHPGEESFCGALFDAYREGVDQTGAETRPLRLKDLQFDPVLHQGYKTPQEWEPDLQEAWRDIEWADQLTFVYPVWWGTMPALMKGFFDRILLPGKAFKFRENSPWWDKKFAGRSARLMVTMDTPPWYYHLRYRSPGHHQMKHTILGFCGIHVKGVTEFSPLKTASSDKRARWLHQAHALGRKDGMRGKKKR